MSRNEVTNLWRKDEWVTSRKGRVSRNLIRWEWLPGVVVTSRKGRVSRNVRLIVSSMLD